MALVVGQAMETKPQDAWEHTLTASRLKHARAAALRC